MRKRARARLKRATTAKQYDLARETALEGLYFVRAARESQSLDPGLRPPSPRDTNPEPRLARLEEA